VRAVAGEREPYLALVWNEELGAIQRAELRIECWNIRREQEVTPQEIEAQNTVLGRVIAARAERGLRLDDLPPEPRAPRGTRMRT
jgi:hypothetical protein